MMPMTRTSWIITLSLLCLGLASCEGQEDEGLLKRGAACNFQEDCAPPTVCAKTSAYEWTICTGTVREGGACTERLECRFERQDGLPLDCTAGVCAYPPMGGADAGASEDGGQVGADPEGADG